MSKRVCTALAALAFVTVAGCGTSNDAGQTDGGLKAESTPPTPDATPKAATTTQPKEVKPRKASCNVEGSQARATLEDNVDNVVLTFDGEKIAATDTTGFYATVYDEAGEHGGQIGAQYLDGKLIAYFTAVETDGGQTNMTGRPEVSGSRIIMTFPKSMGGLGDFAIAKWSAAYTMAGKDIGMCPGDYDTQPFPN